MRRRRLTVLNLIIGALFVAATAAVLLRGGQATQRVTKLSADPDAAVNTRGNVEAIIGNLGESDRGPASADEEKYLQRAYPDTEIPFQRTLDAQAAFAQIKARGTGNKTGVWSLYGPSSATVPEALSFYGGFNAKYVTSGRVTSLVIDPKCSQSKCRLWVGAAGGGIWRTQNALAGAPGWEFVSEELSTNAIGSLALDPTDPSGNTLYAGTGEANASGDSAAGLGLYKSTDGGSTWLPVGTSFDVSFGRSIGSIAIDPTNANTIYIGTTRGVRGVSSVSGGAVSLQPGAPAWGLYKSTDGGATWSFLWNGGATAALCDTVAEANGSAACSLRGVRRVKLDPLNPGVVYAAAYQQGIWRSADGGTSWERIFYPVAPGFNTDRTEFDVTLKDGATRMYVSGGAQGAPYSRAFRGDAINTKTADQLSAGGTNAGWTSLTSNNPSDPRFGSYNFCTGQCWYDQYITTPPGFPDVVYLGGSHQYGEIYNISNGRGVVMSSDAGATWSDMTVEGQRTDAAINLHPDHHFLVTHPRDPYIFFSASDGGVVRSSGTFSNISAQCDTRGIGGANLTACKNLLKRVPARLFSLNKGLSTLQFQSVLINPHDHRSLLGGTQDNGTWLNNGSSENWYQTIYGDGGQGGFDVTNPDFRFNTFTGAAYDANFRGGDPTAWVVISGPLLNSGEGAAFYSPIISDPTVGGTMFAGLQSVWRTKQNGGDQAYLEANCPEFSTSAANPSCGDWVRLGTTTLTSGNLGSRGGGTMAAVERSAGDTGTLWAATSTGRLFVSKNADAEPASSASFDRIDDSAANAPNRFVSSIYVDPANPNRAWVSYSGYSAATPATPGHVFEVLYDPAAGTATWTSLDGATGGPLGDLPVTDLVRDDLTGDLYAATDFGVAVLRAGSNTWVDSGVGLPKVEVAGISIDSENRVLYAGTHGRSAWRLLLP